MPDLTHLAHRILVSCSIWHSPLCSIVRNGIEIKCKSCRGVLESIPREKIEQAWKELDAQEVQERGVPHD